MKFSCSDELFIEILDFLLTNILENINLLSYNFCFIGKM